MAHSTRTLRIAGASLLAVFMVGGTYLSTGPNPFFGMTRIAGAQSSEELLREYAAKDSDADGLPDWQESLYGTDPLNPESFQAGIKDGEAVAQGLIEPKVVVRPEEEPIDPNSIPGIDAVPDSLTDRFSQTLLKQYLLNKGTEPPTQEEILAFVQQGVAELSATFVPKDAYSSAQVRSSGTSGEAALRAYAAQVDAAFETHTVSSEKNELFYFEDAMKGSTSALKKIADISEAYTNIADALMDIPVPQEAQRAHLSIVNALMQMSDVTEHMASMESDPLRALMGIGLYQQSADRVVTALTGMHGIFTALQVTIPAGTDGYELVQMANYAAQVSAKNSAQ
ncbi:MAG: hypothetical protein QG636_361 [Patescibacteria group bacterium]|nr:hypothetical protein [Patescibacteria group bacterium]